VRLTRPRADLARRVASGEITDDDLAAALIAATARGQAARSLPI
jgi:anthranilate phosphoribosyltransferase